MESKITQKSYIQTAQVLLNTLQQNIGHIKAMLLFFNDIHFDEHLVENIDSYLDLLIQLSYQADTYCSDLSAIFPKVIALPQDNNDVVQDEI